VHLYNVSTFDGAFLYVWRCIFLYELYTCNVLRVAVHFCNRYIKQRVQRGIIVSSRINQQVNQQDSALVKKWILYLYCVYVRWWAKLSIHFVISSQDFVKLWSVCVWLVFGLGLDSVELNKLLHRNSNLWCSHSFIPHPETLIIVASQSKAETLAWDSESYT